MGFWESIGGQQFIKGTIPKLTDTLDRIADALERYVGDGTMTATQLANSGTREDALEAALHMVLKDIWENECADGIKFEHLMMARQISNFDDHYPDVAVVDIWEDDRIQLARLLCEINATQSLTLEDLAESMDLPIPRIDELFERAHKVWEESKRRNS